MDGYSILNRIGSGTLISEIGTEISAASEEVIASGKPVTVNVTFKIEKMKNNDEPLVTVTPEVTRKTKRQVRAAFFYAVNGDLHKEDPRQMRMGLQEVKRAAVDTADVPAKSVDIEYAERRVE